MHSSLDARVALIAMRQHGLVTLAQARAAGATRAMVRARVAARRWLEIERGVYAIAGSPATWRQRLLAAALTLGPTGVAATRSGAALFGVPGFPERPIELLVLRPEQGRPRSGLVRQTKLLPESHRTVIDGIPVTALPRTIFDLASPLPMGRVARALDHSLAYGLAPVERFWDVFFDLAERGRTGTRVMRVLLNERAGNYVAPASELEDLFRAMVRRYGLPEPRAQIDLGDDENWIGRVDYLFPANLVVETDGRRYHSALLDRQSDADRDERLRTSGRRILRFTWQDIVDRPDACVEAIRRQVGLRVA
jgi:very-short-patch-repair endonuclease